MTKGVDDLPHAAKSRADGPYRARRRRSRARVETRAEGHDHRHVCVHTRGLERDEKQAAEAISHGRWVLASSAGCYARPGAISRITHSRMTAPTKAESRLTMKPPPTTPKTTGYGGRRRRRPARTRCDGSIAASRRAQSITTKGGEARELTAQRRFAPITMDRSTRS